MTEFTILIPARYGSTRLPEKLMRSYQDKPILVHTYEQACLSTAKNVYVIVDDDRLLSMAKSWNLNVLKSQQTHQTGTDRIAEAARLLDLSANEIIVNLQGDEPLIAATNINQVANLLARHETHSVATLASPIDSAKDACDPNCVKVVFNAATQQALYFSRACIPYERDNPDFPHQLAHPHYRHLGLYAYRNAFLQTYITWPVSQLQAIERLEQLRILENGHTIAIDLAQEKPAHGIDSEADYQRLLIMEPPG